jgi:hypothetical protein
MKKTISVILVLIAIVTIFVGCDKKPENDTPTNETTLNETMETLSFAIDDSFEKKVSFQVPHFWEGKHISRISSDFDAGYYSITICYKVEDGNHIPLFTIYSAKGDTYKEFEDQKNYEVLENDKTYTYVWFEYDTPSIEDPTIKKDVELFKSYLGKIKDTVNKQ